MNLFLVVGLVAVAASVATALELKSLRVTRSPHHRKDGRSNSYTHAEANASASGYAEKTTNTQESEKLHRGYDRGVFRLVDRRLRGKGNLEGSHGTGLKGASGSSITDSGISTGISGSNSDDDNAYVVGHQFPNVGIGSIDSDLIGSGSETGYNNLYRVPPNSDSDVTGSQNEGEKHSLSNSSTVRQGKPNCIDVRGFMYIHCTGIDVPNSSTVNHVKPINRGTGISSGSNSDDDNAHIVGHQFPNVGIGSIDSDVSGSDGETGHISSHRVPPNSGRSESGYEINTVTRKPNPGPISSGSSHEFDRSSVKGQSSTRNNNENSSLPSSSTVNNGKLITAISSGSNSDDDNAHIVGHQFPNVGIGSLDSHITGSQNEEGKDSLSNSSTISQGKPNCIDVRGSVYTRCTGIDVPNSSAVNHVKPINRGTGISSGSNSDDDNAHIVGHQFPNVGIGSIDSDVSGSDGETGHISSHRVPPNSGRSESGYEINTVTRKPNPGPISSGSSHEFDRSSVKGQSSTRNNNENSSLPSSSTVNNGKLITAISSGSNSDDDNAHIVGHQFPNVGIGSLDSHITGSQNEEGKDSLSNSSTISQGKPNCIDVRGSVYTRCTGIDVPNSSAVNHVKPINRGTGISSGSNSDDDNAHIVGHQFPNVGIGSLDSHITGSQNEEGKDSLSNSSTVSQGKPNCIDVRGSMYTRCTGIDVPNSSTVNHVKPINRGTGISSGSNSDDDNAHIVGHEFPNVGIGSIDSDVSGSDGETGHISSHRVPPNSGTSESGYEINTVTRKPNPGPISSGSSHEFHGSSVEGQSRGGHQDSSSFSSSSSISPNYSFSSISGHSTQPFGNSSMASSGGIWNLQ